MDVLVTLGKDVDAHIGKLVSVGAVLPFLALAVILVPIFMMGGFKKGVYRATVAIGCTVVSFVLSLVAAKLFANTLSALVYGLAKPVLEEYFDGGNIPEHVSELLKGGIAAALAIVLFVLLLFILLLITKLVIGRIPSVKNGLSREDASEGFKCGGMLIGLVDALVIAFLFTAPIMTTTGFAASMLRECSDCAESVMIKDLQDNADDFEYVGNIKGFCKPIHANPLIKISCVRRFDFSTSVFGDFTYDGEKYNFYDVVYDGVGIVTTATSLTKTDMTEYGEAELNLVKYFAFRCRCNRFLLGLVSEVTPLFIDGADGDGFAATLASVVRDATVDDYAECIEHAAGLFELALNNGIFKASDNSAALVTAVSNPTFIKEAVYCMRSSDMLSRTLDGLVISSVDFLVIDNGDDETASALSNIKNNIKANMANGTNDIDAEIKALTLIAEGMSRIMANGEELENGSFTDIDTSGVAGVLIGLGTHPYIGEENIDELISVTLRSFNGTAGDIFGDEFIDLVIETYRSDLESLLEDREQGKFENLLVSSSYLVNVVETIGDDNADKDNTVNMIGELMDVMSADTAEDLATVITSEFIKKLNINVDDAEKVSAFVRDILLNMVDVKENGGDIEKEKQGITELMSMTLNISEKMNDGETTIDDMVDGTLEEFLTKVTDSEVVMKTVGNAVSENGENPTGAFSVIKETDAESINKACNNLLSISGGDSWLAKKLELIRIFMGIK